MAVAVAVVEAEVEAEAEAVAMVVAVAAAVKRINPLRCLWTILIWTWITIMLKRSTLEFQAVELLRELPWFWN